MTFSANTSDACNQCIADVKKSYQLIHIISVMGFSQKPHQINISQPFHGIQKKIKLQDLNKTVLMLKTQKKKKKKKKNKKQKIFSFLNQLLMLP